jgi:hypothetical protein
MDRQIPKDGERYMYTARKFDRATAYSPLLSDRLWNTTKLDGMENLPHRQGTMYAFNAAFKDGHVVYVRGPANLTNSKAPWGTFDKAMWDKFGNEVGENSNATLEFYTRIYGSILP